MYNPTTVSLLNIQTSLRNPHISTSEGKHIVTSGEVGWAKYRDGVCGLSSLAAGTAIGQGAAPYGTC